VSDHCHVSATLPMEQVNDSHMCRWVEERQIVSECGGKGRDPFYCWEPYVNFFLMFAILKCSTRI